MRKLLLAVLMIALSFQTVYAAEADLSQVPYALTEDQPFPDINDPENAFNMFVYFLGVGAMDATLVAAGGKTMLIDCGYYYAGVDVFKRLNTLGISHIDYAVCTHPHDDHLLGFMTLVDSGVTIGKFYYAHDEEHTDVMVRFMEYARGKQLNLVKITTDDDISFGGIDITLIRYPYQEESFTNNSSLIMRLEYGKNSVLMLADITEPEEWRLVEEYPDKVKCDILKLAHHGFTIPQWGFTQMADPDFCVLTNSSGNVPVETLNRLEFMDYCYGSTTNGTIACMSDGENWTVKTIKLTQDPWTEGD